MVGGTVTKLLIELNKNKLDVDEEEYNSKKFDIKFSVKVGRLSPTQFELRNILQEKFQNESTWDKAIEDAIANVPLDSKDYARNLLENIKFTLDIFLIFWHTTVSLIYERPHNGLETADLRILGGVRLAACNVRPRRNPSGSRGGEA